MGTLSGMETYLCGNCLVSLRRCFLSMLFLALSVRGAPLGLNNTAPNVVSRCKMPVPSSWRSEKCDKNPCQINVFGGPCMGCACVNNGEHNPDPYGGMLCSKDMTPA